MRCKVASYTGALLRSLPMRPAAILSLAVVAALAGCTTSSTSSNAGASSEWLEIQSQRLARVHAPPTSDEALAEVLARAPMHDLGVVATFADEATDAGAAAALAGVIEGAPVLVEPSRPAVRQQDPQTPKLDQRLPQRPDVGPRSFHHSWQPLVATVDYGLGNVMARSDGTRLNDRADATFVRARLDSGTGAALHAEWWGSEQELFDDMLINDGVTPKKANAELGGIDVFPHLRFDTSGDNWTMPVRLGLFADWHQLDHQLARVEREWLSFGPRLVAEPTFRLLEGSDSSLQLFSRIGVDAGAAWFSEEFRGGDDRDFLPRWGGEIGAGLRGEFGSWHLELGYRLHHTMYGETQGDLFGRPGRTELQRQQVYLGVGIRY